MCVAQDHSAQVRVASGRNGTQSVREGTLHALHCAV